MSVVNLNEVRELKENELGSAKQIAELDLPSHLSMLLPLRTQFKIISQTADDLLIESLSYSTPNKSDLQWTSSLNKMVKLLQIVSDSFVGFSCFQTLLSAISCKVSEDGSLAAVVIHFVDITKTVETDIDSSMYEPAINFEFCLMKLEESVILKDSGHSTEFESDKMDQFNVNVLYSILNNIKDKLSVNGSFAHYKEDKYFKCVFQLESLLYGYVKVTYS